MLKVAVLTVPFKAAVITAEVGELTAEVAILNVADEAAGATVTEVGTVAPAVLLDSAMVAPPGPAGPLRAIVPTEELPPNTKVGLTLIPDNTLGLMVSVAVCHCPLIEPVMTAVA